MRYPTDNTVDWESLKKEKVLENHPPNQFSLASYCFNTHKAVSLKQFLSTLLACGSTMLALQWHDAQLQRKAARNALSHPLKR